MAQEKLATSDVGRPSWKNWILARLLLGLVRILCATLRLKIHGEARCDEAIAAYGGCVFVTWHGRAMLPIDYFRGRGKIGYHTLVSLSRDGDFLSEYFRACGLQVIRGSNTRRGAGAAREVVAKLKQNAVLSFTPDGPRGPAQVAHPGVAYFAVKSGRPIIPAGIAAWPRWDLRSWDKFMVPKPFARAHWIYGEPIFVREGDNLEEATLRIADAITTLQQQAEAMVNPATIVATQSRAGSSLEEQGRVPQPINRGRRVLVVDDHPDIRHLMERELTGEGYIVETAANGQEAWAMLQTSLPDALITDNFMPGMSGRELIYTIRHEARLSGLPILLLTAMPTATDILPTEKADYYLPKPFSPIELSKAVSTMLAEHVAVQHH